MDRKIMGYARVSSKEQNLDRQILQLKKYVQEIEVKFTDLFSEVVNSTPAASYLDRDFCLLFFKVNRVLL